MNIRVAIILALVFAACQQPDKITVLKNKVTGVSLDKTTLNLTVNGEVQLTETVAPANAANTAVTWSSDNEAVAAVSGSGLVTAVAEGTAIITVTTADGGHTAECTVNVVWRLTSIEEVIAYLAEKTGSDIPDEPIYLPLQLDLGDMTSAESDWQKLLTAVYQAIFSSAYYSSIFFDFDLRACTIGGPTPTTFDPDSTLSILLKSKIVSIILPDTATSIRDGTSSVSTFKHFTKLKSVSGANITAIGEYIFRINDGLTDADFSLIEVDFPSAESIGYAAFRTCRNLSKVNFPAARVIGSYAFMDCDSLETVSFPAVTNINTNAFRNCRKLREAKIPALTSIDSDAFYGCGLVSVNFPAVTGIGDHAFYNCGNLTSANFPVVTGIGDSAFYNCTSLASASFPVATSIGGNAFYGCEALSEISFPRVTSIGNYAFYGCADLAEANFPRVTSIETYAFEDCTGLVDISFPRVTSIGISAFNNCGSLTSVEFPAATSIGRGAFFDCGKLIAASFPAASSIGRDAFQNTGTSNIVISLGNNAPELGETIFSDVTRTVNVSVPDGAGGSYSPDWISGLRGRGYVSDGFLVATVRANITVNMLTQGQTVVVFGPLTLPFLRNTHTLALVPPAISSNSVTIAGQGWQTSDDGASGWTIFTPPANAATNLNGKSLRYYVTAGSNTWYSNAVIIKVWSANAREVTVNMWDKPGDGWEGNGALRIKVNGSYLSPNAKAAGHNSIYYFAVEPNDTVTFYWIKGINQRENAFAVYYRTDPPSPAFNPDPKEWEDADDPGNKVLLYRQYDSMNDTHICICGEDCECASCNNLLLPFPCECEADEELLGSFSL